MKSFATTATLRFSKLLLFAFFLLVPFFTQAEPAFAQTCSYNNQCINNQRCFCIYGYCAITQSPCGSAIIGDVEPPKGVAEYNEESGGEVGLLLFASRVIQLLSVIAGLFVGYNFITAGFTYVGSAGNPQVHAQVKDKLTYGFMGLALIVSAYTLAGIFGLLFFGDAGFALNPSLGGAVQ